MHPACNGAIAKDPGGRTPILLSLLCCGCSPLPGLKWKLREREPFEFKVLGAERKMKSGSGKHVRHQDSLLLPYFIIENDEVKKG